MRRKKIHVVLGLAKDNRSEGENSNSVSGNSSQHAYFAPALFGYRVQLNCVAHKGRTVIVTGRSYQPVVGDRSGCLQRSGTCKNQ